MKVSFVANFLNHHQLAFSLKMMELTDNEYHFIAHNPIYSEQVSLGYQDMNNLPFVIRTYESEVAYRKAMDIIKNDDLVIFGGCPNEWVEERSKTGKPFIIYSERFFKKGVYRRFIPITYKKIYDRMLKFKNDNVAVICSSAYLPYDLKLLHSDFRTIKWGYFPDCKTFEKIDDLIKAKEENSLIWVGRFIKLKHPEDIIYVAKQLKQSGYKFSLRMIGNGPLFHKMKKLVTKLDVKDCVEIVGALPASKVREEMERSQIMITTSDKHEGWGAVINEAMNSACAVVASHLMGAVPYLIKNGENGFCYKSGSRKAIYDNIAFLLDNKTQRENVAKNAYDTIQNMWNAENATERLYSIITDMVEGRQINYFSDGPCSFAKIIKPKFKVMK